MTPFVGRPDTTAPPDESVPDRSGAGRGSPGSMPLEIRRADALVGAIHPCVARQARLEPERALLVGRTSAALPGERRRGGSDDRQSISQAQR